MLAQEEQSREQTFRPSIPVYRPEHGGYDDLDRSVSRIDRSFHEMRDSKDIMDPYRDLYGVDLPQTGHDQPHKEAPYMEHSG